MDTKWNMTTPAEAGFAPDLDENFEIARQAGTLPNLHSVIAARGGHIFFERYLAGPDAGRSPLGVIRFGPETLHDMRSCRRALSGCCMALPLRQAACQSLRRIYSRSSQNTPSLPAILQDIL
jgi:hypothetical protein